MLKDILVSRTDTTPLPDEIMEGKETSKELYIALNRMKQSYREVIILRKIKGFSIKETSEVLSWSESKVKSTLHRAIPALEKLLHEEGFLNEKTI